MTDPTATPPDPLSIRAIQYHHDQLQQLAAEMQGVAWDSTSYTRLRPKFEMHLAQLQSAIVSSSVAALTVAIDKASRAGDELDTKLFRLNRVATWATVVMGITAIAQLLDLALTWCLGTPPG